MGGEKDEVAAVCVPAYRVMCTHECYLFCFCVRKVSVCHYLVHCVTVCVCVHHVCECLCVNVIKKKKKKTP